MLTISTHNLNRELDSYPAVKEIDLELTHGEALRFFTLMETSKTTAMPKHTGSHAEPRTTHFNN